MKALSLFVMHWWIVDQTRMYGKTTRVACCWVMLIILLLKLSYVGYWIMFQKSNLFYYRQLSGVFGSLEINSSLKGRTKNVVDFGSSFTSMVCDYNSYAERVFNARCPTMSSSSHWSPPADRWIKINVDAHVANGMRGLGTVARDSAGNLLLAGVRKLRVTWSPAIFEMAIAVYGVETTIRMGYSFVHLEGDNANVIKGITNEAKGCSPFFLLLDRVLHLSNSFLGFKCSSIRRSGNTATHMVARRNYEPFLSKPYNFGLS